MVISNTNTKSIYNCNGTTRNFNLGFVFDENVSSVGILVKHADGTTDQVENNYEIIEGVLTYPTVESELDPLPEGDKLIIERFTPLTQTINLTQQGPLDAETLEGGYDKNTLISQELQEQIGRAIKFPVTEEGETDAQEYINDLQALVAEATAKASEAATSATAADTAKTTAQKWAEGTDSQVQPLGGTHSAKGWADISEAAATSENVQTVVNNITDINTVAGISSDVSQVSDISAAVSNVSAHDSDVTLVSDNMNSVTATATSIADVQTVAGIASDVSAVAGIASDVSAVEDIKTDVSAVASNATNINTVASNTTNINTVATNSADVTTVATNISNVNTAATNMAAIIAAPSAAANAATSEANTQTWAEGSDAAVAALGGTKSSKGWANRAQEIVDTIGTVLHYKGSVATYADLPSTGNVIGDVWNVLEDGSNYAWDGTGWDKFSGTVDLSAYRTAANQDIIDGNLSTAITSHTGNTNNPHSVTKAQVGLGNVDNTADLDKPISTATQTALDGKQATISSAKMLSSDLVDDTNNTNKFVTASDKTTWNGKQDALVSGTNIKTVNGNSLLGSGNVDIDALPAQTGQSGRFLTTDGSAASWADIPTEVDNKSVTLNSNDEIQTIGVIDQKTSSANKFWTGTKAEYDAIVTKDQNTTYRTTDETEIVYQNSYRIGQVLPSILPISDYGLHLLDGSVIDGTGIYSSFYSYIAGLVSTYPNLFISEADWQTAVTTYGVCGKFVYDSTNQTIRLPKITGIIEGTTDVTALGDLVQAGLPNITGGMSPTGLAGVSNSYGAFYDEVSNTTDYSADTRGGYGVRWGFNAARLSSIYGNSSTVQPQTIKVYYYIVIANSYQTPTGVQISRVATDLNGKVNLNSSWGMPSNNYTDLSAVSGQYYTASADGCFVLWGTNTNANSSSWVSLTMFPAQNDNTIGKQVSWTPQVSTGNELGATISCKKGDRCYVAFYNTTVTRLRFIYAQKDNN